MGQKLTVYTNIISGPRRGKGAEARRGAAGGESDGPEHFHVVLVDNGRSRILGSELAEILYCIRCGACLNACPVYQQIGGHAYGSVYPGPVGAVLTTGLRGLGEWSELPQASSLCGACREVCPVRIDIPRMLLALRDRSTKEGETPSWVTAGLWLLRYVAERPRLFRTAQRAARLASRAVARDGWIRYVPGHLARWTDHRDFRRWRRGASWIAGRRGRDERQPLQRLASIDRQIRLGALPPGAGSSIPPPPVSDVGGDLVARFEAEASGCRDRASRGRRRRQSTR
jgi:L-lactate dehydrogenase complex protein LldF